MILPTGTLLAGRYEIVRPITTGGFGAVYEARDRRLSNSPCAVKRLLDRDLDAESAAVVRRKFTDESSLLGLLDHEGIPRIRDAFHQAGDEYLVMDFVEGKTLEQELIDAAGPLGSLQVVEAMLEVLDILIYLHSLQPQVLHRDIKPSNILRERGSGRIKLVDFGIARLLADLDTATQTQMGTLSYAPIEQIQGRADVRSDVYSTGATMHHLLSGRLPAPLNIPPLKKVAPHVDERLAALVNCAVAPDRNDRFDSAQEMRTALVRWRMEGTDPEHLPPIVAVPEAEMAPTVRVRPRGLVTLAGAAAALLFFGVGLPRVADIPLRLGRPAQAAPRAADANPPEAPPQAPLALVPLASAAPTESAKPDGARPSVAAIETPDVLALRDGSPAAAAPPASPAASGDSTPMAAPSPALVRLATPQPRATVDIEPPQIYGGNSVNVTSATRQGAPAATAGTSNATARATGGAGDAAAAGNGGDATGASARPNTAAASGLQQGANKTGTSVNGPSGSLNGSTNFNGGGPNGHNGQGDGANGRGGGPAGQGQNGQGGGPAGQGQNGQGGGPADQGPNSQGGGPNGSGGGPNGSGGGPRAAGHGGQAGGAGNQGSAGPGAGAGPSGGGPGAGAGPSGGGPGAGAGPSGGGPGGGGAPAGGRHR